MSEPETFRDSLTAIFEKVGRWRKDAAVIKTLAAQASASRAVSEEQLLKVEETSTEIYQATAAFDALVAKHANPTDLDHAIIAEVGDALRLVLLEITELSVAMYSARSAWALDDGTPDAPVPELGSEQPAAEEPAVEGDVWR